MHSFFLQLGRLHIPIYGVFAALGLMAALTLSQRTARYARLAPEAVWNAGMTAIVSAFVISRLLLIVFNLRSFLAHPLLVLALPSLTTLGLLLAALVMLGYTRWRELPLLALLDAAAPCIALLWGFINLGYLLDGTRDGMPRYSGSGPVNEAIAAVYPVEAITLAAAALLCVLLFLSLASRSYAGRTSGIGLFGAGLAVFFIDFFRLPSDLVANSKLDPAQIIGLTMCISGSFLYCSSGSRARRTEEASDDAV